MKKLLIIFLITPFLFTQELKGFQVAVIPFEAINVNEGDAVALSYTLLTEIGKIGKFTVVERSAMEKVISEQKFQHSGCVEDMCAVEIGKILSANFIIVGDVSLVGITYIINARLINVETGEPHALQVKVDEMQGLYEISRDDAIKEIIDNPDKWGKILPNYKENIKSLIEAFKNYLNPPEQLGASGADSYKELISKNINYLLNKIGFSEKT